MVVNDLTLGPGGVETIIYGEGGGTAAVTIPGRVGEAMFFTQEASTPSGTLAALAVAPQVTVASR